MQHALLAHAAPVHTCLVEAALEISAMLENGSDLTKASLRRVLMSSFGTSDADGAWTARTAYDALEAAQLLFLIGPGSPISRGDSAGSLARIAALAARLPTQSVRGEDQIAYQAFSTPAPLAWLTGVAAELRRSDTVLEPSAGTGLLLIEPIRTGCALVLNELDPVRRRLLARIVRREVHGHDAELMDDLLDPGLRPTVVLMNPPFARSVGRSGDPHAAVRHLAAALRRLAPGGRLVALMPRQFQARKFAGSQADMAGPVSLRLDLLLQPGAFAKHGTGVPVRIVVLEKVADAARVIEGIVSDLDNLRCRIAELPPRRQADDTASAAANRPAATLRIFRSAAAPPRPVPPARRHAPAIRDSRPLAYEVLEQPTAAAAPVGIYLPYRASRVRIHGAQPHPTPLVESLAMGSIPAPRPCHEPRLPERLVAEGLLSEAQLETLIYAGSAFERDLPGRFQASDQGCALAAAEDGKVYRTGYFLGDGTGAGKGRQIAGILLDRWLRGCRRHIWLSKNETLLEDARRDWSALGGLPLDVQPLSQWKLGAPVTLPAGILFVTYPTLRSGREAATRLKQLLDWAGDNFEGVVAFDEAHAMANAAGGEGPRGKVKGSEQGIAGIRLQNLLPRARILYASATGASDVNNLAYATRLGLWGPETAFADRNQFIASIRSGGIAAMELVARDLKALGLYTSRALSFAGVEYDVLEHALTPAQVTIYDSYADAWAVIHANLGAALEATRVVDAASGATLNANARSAALSRFEGAKQRFFGQLLLSMKLPSLVTAIKADLGAGRAVVVQLVSTAEAILDRRLAELGAEERESLEIDLSPREYVIDYLLAAFPTRQMRVFTDAEGNCRSEPMSDEDGNPVRCRAAILARDEMVERLCALPPIGTALDTLLERFGADRVAEVTGRSRRLVSSTGGRQKLERRSPRSNIVEAEAFMRGDKRVLVFSDAGGTGRSYHACLDAVNRARRVHYLLEPGWRADAAIQGLGRTHRTRQASAPLFRPVTTDVRGERRFISTIARRLDALGALTRGQRQTGGQNLFDPADNLESRYAKEALTSWYHLLHAGKLSSVSFASFQALSGLRLESEGGSLREDLPPIQRWLNRLLALRIAMQNAIFEEFMGLVEARVAAAREAGTLDIGVETVSVETFDILEDRVLRTDPRSGATTHLLTLDLRRRQRVIGAARIDQLRASRPDALPMLNRRSGGSALRLKARSLTSDEGLSVARFELLRPTRRDYIACDQLVETSWEPAGRSDFLGSWEAEVREAKATLQRETIHLATGLLLPIWDKLPEDSLQVIRIAAGDGRSLLGRAVPATHVAELGVKLGVDLPASVPPDQLAAAVLQSGKPLPVSAIDALVLKRSLVNADQRLELTGYDPARLPWYKAQGCFTEIIRYQTRLFVPVSNAAAILSRITSSGNR